MPRTFNSIILASFILAATVLFLFWPVLRQPFLIDDLDIALPLAFMSQKTASIDLAALFHHCTLPFFFRPLLVPFFVGWNLLFGLHPAGLRFFMLLLQLATMAFLFMITSERTENRAAGFFAAFFYGISWIHWDTLGCVSNIGESFAGLLLWMAFWLYDRSDRNFGKSAAFATGGLFLKESVISFCPLALAARPFWKQSVRDRIVKIGILTGWACLYLAIRAFFSPHSPFSGGSSYAFAWSGALGVSIYSVPLATVLEPFLRPFPLTRATCVLADTSSGTILSLWIVVVLGLGLVAGWSGWRLLMDPSSRKPRPVKNLASTLGLGAYGFVACLLPYAFFLGAITSWDAHRFEPAWAAACIALGPLFVWLVSRLRGGRYAIGMALCLLATVVAYAGAALRVRYQDPDPFAGPFWKQQILAGTSDSLRFLQTAISGQLQENDEFVFRDVPAELRIPQLLQVAEHKRILVADEIGPETRWLVRRTDIPAGFELSVEELKTRRTRRFFSPRPELCSPLLDWSLSDH